MPQKTSKLAVPIKRQLRSRFCMVQILSIFRFPFFHPPQSLKTASLPLSGVRQGWDHPCSQGGHTGRTWPAASSAPPVLPPPPKPHTAPHRRQRVAWLSCSRPWRSIPGALRPSPRACYILYCGVNFDGPAPRNPDPECDPEYRKPPWSGQDRPSGFWGFQV